MAETEGSDDTSENELLNKSLSCWKGNSSLAKEKFEPIPLDLHTASSLGQFDCVKTLIIRQEVDIDKRNKGGWTALMYACYIGHDNIVNLMLDAGCNVNVRNQKGESPLMLAASCGNDRVGFLLCSQEAELEAKDERGWTALFHATYSGHQNMVRFLLEQGANMNAVEESMGMTPFMEAAAEGHEIILQLFLQHGVNVNARAYNGDTARSLALANGNMKIVSLIDNHVMPITCLRAEAGLEADLSSSDDALSRRNPLRAMRGKPGMGGAGPSIRDGPEAIARLIDRTRDHTGKDGKNIVQATVPQGYMTFPEGDTTIEPKKLSYRDVTSPISPDDYKLENSTGKESSFEVEDDTNAFSKTGALTIKSSSGSSGGLAAALGIRREDSLDSDEFPHESSCCDSHPAANSGDSSSEEALEEHATQTNQITETLKVKCQESDDKPENASEFNEIGSNLKNQEKKKVKSKKPKDKLTTDNVSEIEVLKNSVTEWINSVHDSNHDPVPDNNIESPSPDSAEQVVVVTENTTSSEQHLIIPDKQSALKPEYQQKHQKPSEYQFHSDNMCDFHIHRKNSGHVEKISKSELFDQVANNVQNYSRTASKDFLQQPVIPAEAQSAQVSYDSHVSHTPVSALSLLNTNPDTFTVSPSSQTDDHGISQGAIAYPGHHSEKSVKPPPGFPVQYNAYPVFSHGTVPGAAFPPEPGQCHVPNQQLPISHGNAPYSLPPVASTGPVEGSSHDMGHGMAMKPATLTSPGPPSVNPPVGNFSADTQPGHLPHGGAVDVSSLREALPSTNSIFMEKMREPNEPADLATFLYQLGLSKYHSTFEEQDVDLQVFLSLTDNDLKEIGIKLFGPRKKMTNAIARWHSKARVAVGELEQAYADRLEGEMQEMGVQLQLAVEQLEKLKAQVKQEQQLRNVTESCLMEERAAWQHVQRIIMDTRQQCEDFKDAVRKMKQYINELKARVPPDSQKAHPKSSGTRNMMSSEQMATDTVLRKVDYYTQEVQHLLGVVTANTDRLLGRNTESHSPERGYPG